MDDTRQPLDLDTLRHAVGAGARFRFRYFWGHTPRPDGQLSDAIFSQWWPCRFVVDEHTYASAEQFMMAAKARLFGDRDTLARILAEKDPAACKALGRAVRGFDDAAWAAARFDLVTRGNVAKFGQEPTYRAYLLATGERGPGRGGPARSDLGHRPRSRQREGARSRNLARTEPPLLRPRACAGNPPRRAP